MNYDSCHKEKQVHSLNYKAFDCKYNKILKLHQYTFLWLNIWKILFFPLKQWDLNSHPIVVETLPLYQEMLIIHACLPHLINNWHTILFSLNKCKNNLIISWINGSILSWKKKVWEGTLIILNKIRYQPSKKILNLVIWN